MRIEGQGHFFTIYFTGFVLYYAKISGERLHDHWSSGYEDLTKIIFQLSSNTHRISSSDVDQTTWPRHMPGLCSSLGSFFLGFVVNICMPLES